ncbi:MAG TPA: CPBP family glutamic-type intramembrane protease [Candidatus Saccharimonadales bacterium]|nr:CPBP family glutamic-type intramembrane protease [Candidatus Saccharimonadales bacterium]
MSKQSSKPTKESLLTFFVLVYALSVPFWLISFLTKNTGLPLDIPIGDIGAAFTPLAAAYIIAWRQNGARAAKALLGRLGDVRKLSVRSLLAVITVPSAVYAATYAALEMLGYGVPSGAGITFAGVLLLLGFFYAGAIGEEAGYTAYAADKALARFGSLQTALLIGTPWALWHVPSMLVQGRTLSWIAWGVGGTIAVRYIYVRLYQTSGGCVSAVLFMHVLFNLGRVLFPHSDSAEPLVEHAAVYYPVIALAALAFGILLRARPKLLGATTRHSLMTKMTK